MKVISLPNGQAMVLVCEECAEGYDGADREIGGIGPHSVREPGKHSSLSILHNLITARICPGSIHEH